MEYDPESTHNWLREQPPAWRPRPEEPARPRWLDRPRDIFEDESSFELFPGATGIEDFDASDGGQGSLRVLARYNVLRVFVLSGQGIVAGRRLRVERRVALEHLALLPPHDYERQALERLATLSRETAPPSIMAALLVCAEAAAKRGQPFGAFELYRAGFDFARRRAWWADAALAARGASRVAKLEEAQWSARLWERRARVLERRVAREAAEAS